MRNDIKVDLSLDRVAYVFDRLPEDKQLELLNYFDNLAVTYNIENELGSCQFCYDDLINTSMIAIYDNIKVSNIPAIGCSNLECSFLLKDRLTDLRINKLLDKAKEKGLDSIDFKGEY